MPIRATEEHNLAVVNPALASEWHPEKNGMLSPADVLPSSGKKYWWRCRSGHEWQATPNNRSKNQGCPFCAGKQPTDDNNLLAKNPALAAEWHPTKNAPLTPEQVLPSSSRRVWWLCAMGHEWQSTISNRTKRGCPFCANKAVDSENNLAAMRPDLIAEWHPTKNEPLKPEGVTPGSGVRAWWKCRYGHEWQTAVVNRTGLDTGCPKCSPQSSRLEVRLYAELNALLKNVIWRSKIAGAEADLYIPDLKTAIEIDGHYWHKAKEDQDRHKADAFVKEGVLLIRVRESPLKKLSEHDVLFRSRDSHESIMHNLVSELANIAPSGTLKESLQRYARARHLIAQSEFRELLSKFPGPDIGNSLLDKEPTIAAQWHPSKNKPLTPEMVSVGSSLRVWWKCTEGHEWQAVVNQRTGESKGGCPYCSGRRASQERNLATVYPLVAEEWDHEKNKPLTPRDVPPHSGKSYWWRCKVGHEWQATVDNRTNGRGCPYCAGARLTSDRSLAAVCPELLSEWHPTKNRDVKPSEVSAGSDRKLWWQCHKGHEWLAAASSRKAGSGCPFCAGNSVTAEDSLSAKHPELVSEWDSDQNLPLTPDQVSSGSGRKVWWVCKNNHHWQAVIHSRVKGHGCPQCSRDARANARKLDVTQLLEWAELHYLRTGIWPTQYSGAVSNCPTENWSAINLALRFGYRGLPKIGGLSKLLSGLKESDTKAGHKINS